MLFFLLPFSVSANFNFHHTRSEIWMSSRCSTIILQPYCLLKELLDIYLTTDLLAETLICLHIYNIFVLLEPSDLDSNCHSSNSFANIKNQQIKNQQTLWMIMHKEHHLRTYVNTAQTYSKYTGHKVHFILLYNFCFRQFCSETHTGFQLSVHYWSILMKPKHFNRSPQYWISWKSVQ